MSARAICPKGHGYERGRVCLDCVALEVERALKAVPLQDTLERLEWTVPAAGPWSAAGADEILADLTDAAARFPAPPCAHMRYDLVTCTCVYCGMSFAEMAREALRPEAT